MLVLTRKRGERIRIGDGVELVVVEIRGNRVRLGIEAPSEVDVRRRELVQPYGGRLDAQVRPNLGSPG